MNATFFDLDDGVGDAVQPPTDSLQLRQPLLQPVSRPPAVPHLHQQRALEPPDVPVHGVQPVAAVLDVLRHLLLDLVQLGDDLVLCVSCQGSQGQRELQSGIGGNAESAPPSRAHRGR